MHFPAFKIAYESKTNGREFEELSHSIGRAARLTSNSYK